VQLAVTQVAVAGPAVTCTSSWLSGTVPASLDPRGTAFPFRVEGELCATPAEMRNGTTVQLLLHGATYNHSYWDFATVDGIRYSYARDLALAGFPTYAFDQIASGQSTRPASDEVNTGVAAYVEHEVVQGLRSGALTGTAFGKVIEVGHSVGSMTSWQEAGTYQDVDGLIITGAVHHTTEFSQTLLANGVYPASQDPRFAGLAWDVGDPGYITTVPGARAPAFYYGPGADPAVIAADDTTSSFAGSTFTTESGKDVLPAGQFDALNLLSSPTATLAIHVPVLIIMGEEDALSCGADARGVDFDCSSGQRIAAQESPFYSPQAELEACAVPDAGHDISLHRTFWIQEAAAAAWSYAAVGQARAPARPERLALPGLCASASGFAPLPRKSRGRG
jgi:pimeloyl-ACP methyl ester carboxylesterase